MQRLIDIAKVIALVVLAFFLFSLGIACLQLRTTLQETERTVEEVKGLASDLRETVKAADVKGTVEKVNTLLASAKTTAETADSVLKEAKGTIADVRTLVTADNGLKGTIQNANGILVQWGIASDALAQSSIKHQQSLDTFVTNTNQTTERINKILEDLRPAVQDFAKTADNAAKLTADPNIPQTLEYIKNTAGHLDGTSDAVEKRVKQMLKPGNFIVNVIKTLLGMGGSAAQIVK